MARRLLQRFLESPVLEPSSGKQTSIFTVLYIYVFYGLKGRGQRLILRIMAVHIVLYIDRCLKLYSIMQAALSFQPLWHLLLPCKLCPVPYRSECRNVQYLLMCGYSAYMIYESCRELATVKNGGTLRTDSGYEG